MSISPTFMTTRHLVLHDIILSSLVRHVTRHFTVCPASEWGISVLWSPDSGVMCSYPRDIHCHAGSPYLCEMSLITPRGLQGFAHEWMKEHVYDTNQLIQRIYQLFFYHRIVCLVPHVYFQQELRKSVQSHKSLRTLRHKSYYLLDTAEMMFLRQHLYVPSLSSS